MAEQKLPQIVLPDQLTSPVDLARTIRELEAVDESLHQATLRKPGQPTKLAKTSKTLEDLATLNNVTLTEGGNRVTLLTALKIYSQKAPKIHMSLATEPSANFERKVTVWLRKNVHPMALLEIGLMPTLAAGCIVRTNNKMFDMSLRHRFTENRHLLVEKISEVKE
jgi:hypothetical protein